MNFLKISALVIGTGSVVGGTGAGVYYAANNKMADINKVKNEEKNKKTQFEGKLVFIKKSGENDDSIYEIKLLNLEKYNSEIKSFDKSKNNNKNYDEVNKVIEISKELNIEETEDKLNKIFEASSTLSSIKERIKLKETEIKELFEEKIYESLKTALGV